MVADNNQQEPKTRKTTKGKQKIEIKMVEKKTSRQVMFTKRRNGLFKKCDKLCSEFGAQIAAVTISEAGNVFSYGHPSPDRVLQDYIHNNTSNNPNFNSDNTNYDNWWDSVQVDDLPLDRLQDFKADLERLRSRVGRRVDEISRTSTNLIPKTNNNLGGFGSDIDYYRQILEGRI